MISLKKTALLGALVASFVAPFSAQAAEPRTVACSVSINYSVNSTLRFPYQKDFVLTSGVPFQDDFSNIIRFRVFDASAVVTGNQAEINIAYYNDVGVFEFIDLRTKLKITDDKGDYTTSGKSSYFTSIGTSGEHITDYSLTCHIVKG